MNEFEKNERSDKIFCTVGISITVVLVLALIIFLGGSIVCYFQSPKITDKRFTAGYTETIISDGEGKSYITYPDKYELQLDSDDWIEVTKQEFEGNHINGHFQR